MKQLWIACTFFFCMQATAQTKTTDTAHHKTGSGKTMKKKNPNKDFYKNDTMPGDRSYRNDQWKPDFDSSKGRIK